MRILSFLIATVLINSCTTKSKEASTFIQTDSIDVFNLDTLNSKLEAIDSSANIFAYNLKRKIIELNEQKQQLQKKINDQQPVTISGYDNHEKIIAELSMKIKQYEDEIAYLNAKIYNDSAYRARLTTTKVINQQKTIVDKPDENSLVIEFDRKLKNDGNIPLNTVDVYIIPYNKRVKSLMQYEINCNLSEINSLSGKKAGYYDGKFFFNNIQPGKYLIKVCAYYGGYEVIERRNGYQTVAMQIAPPIQ